MMFDMRYLVLVAALVAVLPRASGRSIELDKMINKTVCAIDISFDVDVDRIPQRIKLIKCAKQTDRSCRANRIGHRHCCHHEQMECVEMLDKVLVYNKKQKSSEQIEVSVGCACMIRGAHQAHDVLEQLGS